MLSRYNRGRRCSVHEGAVIVPEHPDVVEEETTFERIARLLGTERAREWQERADELAADELFALRPPRLCWECFEEIADAWSDLAYIDSRRDEPFHRECALRILTRPAHSAAA